MVGAVGLERVADLVAVLIIDGAVGRGAQALGRVAHLDIAAVNIRAPDLDRDTAVLHGGLDLDRVVAVIRELELRPAPADRGVHAGFDIAHGEVVAGAGVDFQIGDHGAVIQRGRHLADAAADLLHDLAAGIGPGLLEAVGLRALADDVVIRERLAGLENDAVDLLGGELHVRDAVAAAAGERGGLGGELIGQEVLLQLLLRHFRLRERGRDGDGVAGGRRVPQGLGGSDVKLNADLALGGGLGLGVVARVDRIAADGVVQLLQRHLVIAAHIDRVGRRAELAGADVAEHALGNGGGVERDHARALDDADGAVRLVDLDAAGGEADVDLGGLALDARAQGIGVHVGEVVRGDIMALEGAVQPCEEIREHIAAAAVGIGRLGGGIGRGVKADLRRGDGDGPVTREGHGEHRGARIVPPGGADGIRRGGLRHAADVGAADRDVRENGALFRHEHHADGARRHEDGQHDEHDAHGDFAAAAARFFLFRSRLRLGAGRTAARRLLLPGNGRTLGRRLFRCGGAAGGRLALCGTVGAAAVCRALLRCEIRRLAAGGRAALGSVAVEFHLLESLSFPVKIGLFKYVSRKASASPGGSLVRGWRSICGFIHGLCSALRSVCASRSLPMSTFEMRKPEGVKCQRSPSATAQPRRMNSSSCCAIPEKSLR